MNVAKLQQIEVTKITPNPWNPRKATDDAATAELLKSVKSQGILQPLLVRPVPKGKGYQLIAGARRLTAAKKAGLKVVPCQVVGLDDRASREATIAENEQRADVDQVDRAFGYQSLIDDHGATVEDVAKKIGKSPASVRAALKLVHLPTKSIAALREGKISTATAQLIASRPSTTMREKLEKYALEPDWNGECRSFREVKRWSEEKLMRTLKDAPFNMRDAKLLPAAGCCQKCPKRTGNNKHEYPNTRADVCTDTDCFFQKMLANADRERAIAVEEGYRVLTPGEIKKAYPYGVWITPDDGWIDLDRGCYECQGLEGKTYRELLKKYWENRDVAIAVDGEGLTKWLMQRKDALVLLKEHYGDKFKVQNASLAGAQERNQSDRAKAKKERDKDRALIASVTKLAAGDVRAQMLPNHAAEVMRLIALDVWNRAWGEAKKEVAAVEQVEGKNQSEKYGIINDRIDAMSAGELVAFLAQLLAAQIIVADGNAGRKEVENWFSEKKGKKHGD